ncbi:hypothetical protein Dvar_47860 [Desulfosarcina variabilis str. Montpellier]|jgi:hypothetical protein|uniref:Nif11-like leader peptide family natural product precursor n=1 Tax=Desulfosarcina variabilis TaxID=2300 RepID=UPI003AFABEDD
MTIKNALTFIKRGQEDRALRSRLNSANSADELNEILITEKLDFSAHDFDEAYHHRLTQCQEEEEADQLKEFRMWWDFLCQILGYSTCGGMCSSCG